MSNKGLKPAIARPSARDALAVTQAVADAAGLPPATLPRAAPPPAAAEAALVQLNIRVRRALGDQLADRARAEGVTQKVLVCRALAAMGFAVAPEDLREAPAPRRRGSR
ncbi:hypothetical protein ACI6QG_14370 [Roseococcus sp. DSY-14]|uniref:hypothetical protein n=1 Tax=Roseococcus sp. DSY-14 TaxID=3369650 RepID=UPI00387B2D2B